MKKKKRIKRWLPFICATLLLLGSCLSVSASTVYYVPSDLDAENYYYIIVKTDTNYLCIAVDKSNGFFVQSLANDNNYYLYTNASTYLAWITDDMENWGNKTKYNISGGTYKILFAQYGYVNVVTSSVDVYLLKDGFKTDTIFFQQPPIPIAEMAIPLAGAVQKQTGIILPIAVGCLALLIGSIVLLPRLRNYLAK